MIKKITFLVLSLIFAISNVFSSGKCDILEKTFKYCKGEKYGSHCSSFLLSDEPDSKDHRITCNLLGYDGSHCLTLKPDNRYCICPCSCVGEDTLILMNDKTFKKAKDIKVGDLVHSPFTKNNQAAIESITLSEVTKYPIIKIFTSNGIIEVTDNHTFILKGEIVVRASDLEIGDFLLSDDGNLFEVLKIDVNENYSGGLYNFIINNKDDYPKNHIIVTGSMKAMSGDFLFQTTNDQESIGYLNSTVKIK